MRKKSKSEMKKKSQYMGANKKILIPGLREPNRPYIEQ